MNFLECKDETSTWFISHVEDASGQGLTTTHCMLLLRWGNDLDWTGFNSRNDRIHFYLDGG